MADNIPTKMVTRSISRSDPDVHPVSTFDLGFSQSKEEDALPSEEDRGIGHKIKVRDEVLSPDNDEEQLVKERSIVYLSLRFTFIWLRIVNTRIHGMPLAMKVWLYECCSAVDPKIIVKRGSRISRLLNWETTDRRPHFEAFIEGMLADVDNPVKAESGDLRKLIIDNFKSVMEAIKSIKIAEKGPNVEAAADIPTVPQSSPQDISVSRFSVPNQSDTSTVELQRGHNVEAVEDIPVVSCNAPKNGSRSVTRCLRLRVAPS
ncbi:hypothetical protein FXO38_16552 [Capsicum annuum]|nr:hypothetical protein FXO38_16552 [Capsicum annuum]